MVWHGKTPLFFRIANVSYFHGKGECLKWPPLEIDIPQRKKSR
jgi:hypothetical protein